MGVDANKHLQILIVASVSANIQKGFFEMKNHKTVGIDSLKLSIPINKKLYLNNFRFGAKQKHSSEMEDGTISGFVNDIVISWPKNIRQYYLPEVHFVDYPHHIYGRCYEYQIWIPSLPKLTYGNNIAEIPESDFEKVVDKLYQELVFLELPVEITKQDLRNAKVSRVDYGKNVILNDGSDMMMLNELLQKAPLPRRSNSGKTQFCNGEMFKSCIKSRAFIIYDKLADYKAKTKNSRPAYPNSELQFDLDRVSPNTKLIRLEVQVQTTKQLKIELERLGYPKEKVSFTDIFQSNIAGDMLTHYWHKIEQSIRQNSNLETIDNISVMHRFNQVTGSYQDGPNKTFGRLGFNLFVDTCGLEVVHKSFMRRIPSGKWSVTSAALLVKAKNSNKLTILDTITQSIKDMQRITTKEVEDAR